MFAYICEKITPNLDSNKKYNNYLQYVSDVCWDVSGG